MGILSRLKDLITGKSKEEKVQDDTPIEAPKEPEKEVKEPTAPPEKEATGIQQGDEKPQTEKEAIDEMIKNTKQAQSRKTVKTMEGKINTTILNETQTRPIHTADITPNIRGTYDQLLKGKVTDKRLEEDVIIHREKLLRYRTTATITLIGYDTTKEKPQDAREIGIILISNILPEEESLLGQTIIGLTGSIPQIVSQITGELSGTRIGHIQIINTVDGSNWTVTDMNIIWSLA